MLPALNLLFKSIRKYKVYVAIMYIKDMLVRKYVFLYF